MVEDLGQSLKKRKFIEDTSHLNDLVVEIDPTCEPIVTNMVTMSNEDYINFVQARVDIVDEVKQTVKDLKKADIIKLRNERIHSRALTYWKNLDISDRLHYMRTYPGTYKSALYPDIDSDVFIQNIAHNLEAISTSEL